MIDLYGRIRRVLGMPVAIDEGQHRPPLRLPRKRIILATIAFVAIVAVAALI